MLSYIGFIGFTVGIFEKKSFQKINFGRWSKNVDVRLTDSVSFKEVEFEKMLSINMEVYIEFLIGMSI